MKNYRFFMIASHCLKSVLKSRSRFFLAVAGMTLATLLLSVSTIFVDTFSSHERELYSDFADSTIVLSGVQSVPEVINNGTCHVFTYSRAAFFEWRTIHNQDGDVSFSLALYSAPPDFMEYLVPTFERFDTVYAPVLIGGRVFGYGDAGEALAVIGETESLLVFGTANSVGMSLRVPVYKETTLRPGQLAIVLDGYKSFEIIGVISSSAYSQKNYTEAADAVGSSGSGHYEFCVFVNLPLHENFFPSEIPGGTASSDIHVIRQLRPLGREALDSLHDEPGARMSTRMGLDESLDAFESGNYSLLQTAYVFMMCVFGLIQMVVLFFSVKERVVEIGIKKTLGACPEDIVLHFLIEGVITCSSGAILGNAAALIVCVLIAVILKSGSYPELVLKVSPAKLIAVGMLTLGFGTAFTLAPAWIAAKSRITDALHFD